MKKSSVVCALLSLVIGGVAAHRAHAQSSVTLYGFLDVALVHESGGAAGSINKVSSGVSTGSRLGLKGKEDLGDGLAAVFLLESGFQVDSGAMGQGNLLFGRQAYAGVQSHAGTVTVGRQYTPQYLAVAALDPFGSGYAGDSKNLMVPTGNGSGRMDNTIKYATPTLRGITGELVYAPGEVSGDSSSGRQSGAALAYAGGPLRVRLAYHNRNNDTALVNNLGIARNTLLGATYDWEVVKLHAAYGWNKGLNSSWLRTTNNPYGNAVAPAASLDSRDLLLGLTVPRGPHSLLVSYIYKDDRAALEQDASQLALGYRYGLSKRTELYTVYSHISNRRGAAYTVSSAIESGSGNSAVNFGIGHYF